MKTEASFSDSACRPATGGQEICAHPKFESPRLAREWETVAVMVRLYCRGKHDPETSLCPECARLVEYAGVRLERCQFGAAKPTCAKCPVHCYQRVRREQIRDVMRYAGPRMLWRHPWLALRHWVDGLRSGPRVVPTRGV